MRIKLSKSYKKPGGRKVKAGLIITVDGDLGNELIAKGIGKEVVRVKANTSEVETDTTPPPKPPDTTSSNNP